MSDETIDMARLEKQEESVRFDEIGFSGLKRSGGVLLEEFLPALRGKRGRDVFIEMRDNDPIVGASLLAIKNLTRQADWRVEPGGQSEADVEAARFIDGALHDTEIPFKQFVSQAMSMLVFGWSWFEIVFKRRNGNAFDLASGSRFDDGRIGWRKFAIRSQDSLHQWEFDDDGNVIAMEQRASPNFKLRRIPRSKSLHFVTMSTTGSPEGKSILRNSFRSWHFRKRIEELEGIGLERDLAGIPKVTVPPRLLSDSASDRDKQQLQYVVNMAKRVRNDEEAAIIIPALFDEDGNRTFDFELMSTRGRKNFDTTGIIERKSREIAMSMLSDFIVLGHESVGSFALASSKTNLFSVAIGAFLDVIAEEINRRAIPQLLSINGMTDVEIPTLVHSDIETIDLEALARYVSALSGAGIDLTGEDIRRHLFQQVGITSDTQRSGQTDGQVDDGDENGSFTEGADEV